VPARRLVEVWNKLAGAKPLSKFTDRKTAVRRRWTAMQGFAAKDGEQRSNTGSKRQETAPEGRGRRARESTKTEKVLALIAPRTVFNKIQKWGDRSFTN